MSEFQEPGSTRGRMHAFLEKGLNLSKEQALKSKLKLEHSMGLGQKPNVIPPGEAVSSGDLRQVEVGWHPVGGFAGKWFAEKTGLGHRITKEVNHYPDPTQHWAVLVGDFCHQLWMDENLDVIYTNEKINREEWHTFDVGKTRFNDEALRQTGEMVIHNMRQKRAAYNIISNNCQNFAVSMLDAIQIGAHREFATSFAVYQRMTGRGKIADLWVDKHPEEQAQADDGLQLHRQDTVQNAQQIMDENTTKLDKHHDLCC